MPHRLLIADDSVTIQRVIKLTFADEDVDVVAVGDGSQALAAIDKAPPDIVLADVEMPGCSGYDVARHVRSSPRLSHIPVVLLTGAFEPVDEARASAVGCDGVLSKPFEPQAVLSRVRELLSKPRRVDTVGPAPAPPVTPAAPYATSAPIVAAAVAPPKPAQDLDAYFERLDQAFADLATVPRAVSSAPVSLEPSSDLDALATGLAPVPSSTSQEAGGPSSRSASPLSFSSARAAKDRQSEIEAPSGPAAGATAGAGGAVSRPIETVPEVPTIRSSRPAVQSLVEAFQGLIAEERAAPVSAPQEPLPRAAAPLAAAPPSTSQAPPVHLVQPVQPARPVVVAAGGGSGPSSMFPDEVIDHLAARVMDRLAAEVADGHLADIVSRIAERLVRDEIDLIKRRL